MRARTAWAGAGALAAVAIGGTAAYAAASGPVDSGGVIHGCYTTGQAKGSHALVLQDTGTVCPKGTTAITWNQRGPTGPSTLGPGGLDVVIVQANTNDVGVATATCPADHPYAISGGGSVFTAPVNFIGYPAPMAASLPEASLPDHPNAWAVIAVYTASRPGPDGQVSSVSAYAECVK